jgi:hypothetical protein
MNDSILPLWIQEWQKHCKKAEMADDDEEKKGGSGDATKHPDANAGEK